MKKSANIGDTCDGLEHAATDTSALIDDCIENVSKSPHIERVPNFFINESLSSSLFRPPNCNYPSCLYSTGNNLPQMPTYGVYNQ